MKKALLIILALAMVFSMAACGGGGKAEETRQTAIDTYNLDVKSTEEQPMSSERATKDQLKALKNDYFKGTMLFLEGSEFENVTYGDVKEYLGVDASYYYYEDSLVEKQCFVWQAEEDDNARLLVSFQDSDGKIYGIGSSNLGVSD